MNSHGDTEPQRGVPWVRHGGTEAQRDGREDTAPRRPEELNAVTEKIIGCAIEVHRCLGPSLRESSYCEALDREFGLQGLGFAREIIIPAEYKGRTVGEYRIDFIVDGQVVVEVKAVERSDPVFEAQVLSYLKVSSRRLGLLVNFNVRLLRQGVRRVVRTRGSTSFRGVLNIDRREAGVR